MSTEPKNKWRLLHELVLKAKEAKDFETLGAAVEELSELESTAGTAAKFGNGQYFEAVSNAYIAAWKKLGQWQENPPPIAPQETQIGPGNPFPPPPPPPPTVAPGEWTGELVFNLISPKGLTNPWNYNSASHDERAECERIARAINRNTPLLEPRAETTVISGEAFYKALQKADGGSFGVGAPSCAWEMLGHKSQDLYERAAKIAADTARSKTEPGPAGHADKPPSQAPGSLDELRKTVVYAITSTSEKEVVFGKWGGADVGLLLSALVRMVDKAFADHAAQNSKAIERAAEPVKTPEPWTGETLYLAAEAKTKATFTVKNWPELTNDEQVLWMLAADTANERMGSAPSALKPWTAEQFYLQFGPPDYRLGTLTSVRLGTAQREACEKAAAVINKWAGIVS